MKDRKPVSSAIATTTKDVSAEPATKGGRVPPTDFISKADHFAKLLQLVSAEPAYKPNEGFLQVSGLNDTLSKL